MHQHSKILLLGAKGLVGGATKRALQLQGYNNLLTPTHQELDLTLQSATMKAFEELRPEYVFLSAAKVGGIHANNQFRADFMLQNLQIVSNVMEAAHRYPVKKLLFLGSSCIYPLNCPRPIKEESLLTGPLEPTNEPYALAKIAGVKLAENFHRQYKDPFFSVMPTNLYGPGDNFHPEHSHVIPGLIRRLHAAKIQKDPEFMIWGSGKPRREFLFVDDLARALVQLMQLEWEKTPQLINAGSGEEVCIADLAKMIAKKIGYEGELLFNAKYPDGMMDKALDNTRLFSLGWRPLVSLEEGLQKTIDFFLGQL